MDGLAVADHRLDALGHVDLGFHRAAFRPDADPAAVGNALFLGQLFADLDEEFRLQRSIDLAVLGPIVEVLGEPVGGRRVGELLGVAELLHVAFEHARHRIAPDLGIDRIGNRRFERFVVHRERPFAHGRAREQAPGAFRLHDEGADHFGFGVRRDVGHVIADPNRAVPFHELARRIPWFSGKIRRCSIVDDAAVDRP